MKKIAVGTIKNYMKEQREKDTKRFTAKYKIGDSAFEVEFRYDLSVDERDLFIRRVVQGSFDGLGQYHEAFFIAMRNATLLQMCSNVPALAVSGERADDGSALLDVNAMDELCRMLMDNKAVLENEEFQAFVNDIYQDCFGAMLDRKAELERINSASYAVRDLVFTLKDLIERIGNMVGDVNPEDLMKYAGALAQNTEGLNRDELVDKVIQLHHENKQ